jgi:hypothetical protein
LPVIVAVNYRRVHQMFAAYVGFFGHIGDTTRYLEILGADEAAPSMGAGV